MSHELQRSLGVLLRELVDGPPGDVAFVLNPGDSGLLASLKALSAARASARPNGRPSVAAHVDHLRYGFELLNRFARGEGDPWVDANYAASWERNEVDDSSWQALLDRLASEARTWMSAAGQLRDASAVEWTGALASVVHLAYHVGAIRQIAPAAAGPRARD